MKSLVSIITPLYNRLDLIPETWKSLQAQTYLNWEWIVVDDGSIDGGDTYINNLAQTDSRIKLLYREDIPKGPSRCRNIGAKKANGKYLLFLDSDDIIITECLEKRVTFLERNKHLDFAVFTQATFQTEITPDQPVFTKFKSYKKDYLFAFIEDEAPWQTSGPLWKKESFIKTGGFREDYTIMEDPELHIRALLMDQQFEVINDQPDFYYRLLLKSPEQEEQFWKNSILGRIQFYKDIYPVLKTLDQKQALSKGIINLYKFFLLARIVNFKTEHQQFIEWVKNEKLLSKSKIVLIQTYSFFSKNSVLKNVPFVKGLIYKNI